MNPPAAPSPATTADMWTGGPENLEETQRDLCGDEGDEKELNDPTGVVGERRRYHRLRLCSGRGHRQ
ncbi:hypothetical protein [Nocardiopsis sp. YSL2]|uniref:hypothetical protein n=1 Tax=Nocardiopsis sp. YSL2 TaxID=2939492 RepID=UPI0026F450B9|nr:hypothetical protein [Nocardiopsis sp. YSL2]